MNPEIKPEQQPSEYFKNKLQTILENYKNSPTSGWKKVVSDYLKTDFPKIKSEYPSIIEAITDITNKTTSSLKSMPGGGVIASFTGNNGSQLHPQLQSLKTEILKAIEFNKQINSSYQKTITDQAATIETQAAQLAKLKSDLATLNQQNQAKDSLLARLTEDLSEKSKLIETLRRRLEDQSMQRETKITREPEQPSISPDLCPNLFTMALFE